MVCGLFMTYTALYVMEYRLNGINTLGSNYLSNKREYHEFQTEGYYYRDLLKDSLTMKNHMKNETLHTGKIK